MTVETTTNKIEYAMNGVLVNFAFTFRTLISTPEDIKAQVTDTTTGTTTTLIKDDAGTDGYTVSVDSDGVGGSITVVSARTSDYELLIFRETGLKQESDYNDFNQFPAQTLEINLDKLTIIDQQQQEEIDRSMKLTIGDSTGVSTELPAPEADAAIGWNGTATALVNNPTGIAKTAIDAAATPDYIGATSSDGLLRTTAPITYVDGGDFITLGIDQGAISHDSLIAGTIASHDTTGTGANVTTLTDGSNADALHIHASITDDKVKVDAAATADYIGATSGAGVLRTGAGLSYADGGDFVTLAVDADYTDTSANDGATDITGAELEELSDGSATILHEHYWGRAGTIISPTTATDAVNIAPNVTTTMGLDVIANSLTTGRGLRVLSNSADASARNVVAILNQNVAAVGAIGLLIDQDANAESLSIDGENTTKDTIVVLSDQLTTGSIASLTSNSDDVSARNLVEIINDNVAAVGAVNLFLRNDAGNSALQIIDGSQAVNRILVSDVAGVATWTNVDYAFISGNDGATDVTAAELETLSDTSNADALHTHAHDSLTAGTIVAHDTTGTGANLTALTDGSNADVLHTHGALGSDTLQTVFDRGQAIVIANTDNQTLSLTNNDTTNNQNTFDITNTTTGTCLTITQTGVLAASEYGLNVESNAIQVNSPLAYFLQDNASSTKPAIEVKNDGTGDAILINAQIGNGIGFHVINTGTNHAVYIEQNAVSAAGDYGLYVHSNVAQVNAALSRVRMNHAGSTAGAFEVQMQGSGDGVFIDHGAVLGAGKHGLEVLGSGVNVNADSALVKIQQNSPSASEPALEIDNNGTGAGIEIDTATASQAIMKFITNIGGNSTKNPSAVAADDWIQIDFGGTTYYIPIYLA